MLCGFSGVCISRGFLGDHELGVRGRLGGPGGRSSLALQCCWPKDDSTRHDVGTGYIQASMRSLMGNTNYNINVGVITA